MYRKKNKKNTNKPRRSAVARDGMTQTVSTLFSATLTSGIYSQSLIPSVVGTGVATSDVFELYRIKALKFRLFRSAALTGSVAACYIPGVTDSLSSESLAGILASRPNTLLVKDAVAPSSWCRVPPRVLQSYMTWYKTVAGTVDPADEVQGFIVAAGSGTDSFQIQIQLTYEFKNTVPSGVTPQMRADQQMRAEKERLLKILSFSPKPAPAVPCSSVQTPGSPFIPKI